MIIKGPFEFEDFISLEFHSSSDCERDGFNKASQIEIQKFLSNS